jgi:hypothetical protein
MTCWRSFDDFALTAEWTGTVPKTMGTVVEEALGLETVETAVWTIKRAE